MVLVLELVLLLLLLCLSRHFGIDFGINNFVPCKSYFGVLVSSSRMRKKPFFDPTTPRHGQLEVAATPARLGLRTEGEALPEDFTDPRA